MAVAVPHKRPLLEWAKGAGLEGADLAAICKSAEARAHVLAQVVAAGEWVCNRGGGACLYARGGDVEARTLLGCGRVNWLRAHVLSQVVAAGAWRRRLFCFGLHDCFSLFWRGGVCLQALSVRGFAE